MFDPDALDLQVALGLHLLAATASGLLVGTERGWRQREAGEGNRVAGIRTFALLGTCGGLVAILALNISVLLAAILLSALSILVVGAFLRATRYDRDATTMVAAVSTLGLGLLAGSGFPELALAGAAVATMLLALRKPMHGMLRALTEEEVQAIARFAVISIAVLPFLPNASFGPYGAWNPFRLWLVVLLVTGFSIAGYVLNRVIGQDKGAIATALIGGAYSSTAVTAAFASQIQQESSGPLGTGIALASAVMYVRIVVLAGILVPAAALQILWLLAPASLAAFLVAGLIWRAERSAERPAMELASKPFHLLPAFGFLIAVALASLLVHWAEVEFGARGAALSIFIAGSFDVDAAIIAYSALPADAVTVPMAALALSGTAAVNMAFKAGIVFVNARTKRGRQATLALLASLAVLVATLGVRAVTLFV
jgi:uncharacterized membrane protein (DUF4010 family)